MGIDSFSVTKEIEFDAGHRVPLHASKCSNPHGHRYKVQAVVVGNLQTEGSSTGMVMDFSDIKVLLTDRVHDKFDHGFIVQRTDTEMMEALGIGIDPDQNKDSSLYSWKVIVVDWTPTAEEMAKAIFCDLVEYIPGLSQINVFETPTSIASYPY